MGVVLADIWLVLLKDSDKRGDWLRPVTGWPAKRPEIREWEQATGETWKVEARRLDQMISARLDPVLVAALKDLAAERGVSLSDLLREAALLLLRREEAQNVITFRVNVTNEQPAGITRESFDKEIKAAVLCWPRP